ncbi:MAG: aldo/keto reductase, partial [Bdellovibrionales bacterium]|nr:aldo/keto reductase [Bdellovibrionales bacterium]
YLDSLLMHSPETGDGLTKTDWEVWKNMEQLHKKGTIGNIGISNVTLEQLIALYKGAKRKPAFVQNRCFADTKWDLEIRKFCMKKKIRYQGFSLLTANREFFGGNLQKQKGQTKYRLTLARPGIHKDVQAIMERTGMEIQQIIFRFAQQSGFIPVTGTQTQSHMSSDLDSSRFRLRAGELKVIENIAFLG